MKTSGIISLAVLSLGFGICGWLCVFKTGMLVARGRKSYEKRKALEEKSRFVVYSSGQTGCPTWL